MTSERPSFGDALRAAPRVVEALRWIVLVGAACLSGVLSARAWVDGLSTDAETHEIAYEAVTKCDPKASGEPFPAPCRLDKIDKVIGVPVETDPPAITARLTRLETARVEQIERLGLEIRERVGLQVGLYRALQATRITPAQRDEIEDSKVAARAKFDELVLRMSPREAADRVLEISKVPR